ncbi:hypothetical protein BMW22_36875 (plasmid) [Rhizobium leguminosarum]|uniref:Uncharacterized protein n=1 Tax=Rhizobium leguminosarum TaxID=384 RepID=A0A1L3ZN44_RHILE|nr:hypothetical protein BMW22_36875 [Rhizobium leguminosarum]
MDRKEILEPNQLLSQQIDGLQADDHERNEGRKPWRLLLFSIQSVPFAKSKYRPVRRYPRVVDTGLQRRQAGGKVAIDCIGCRSRHSNKVGGIHEQK